MKTKIQNRNLTVWADSPVNSREVNSSIPIKSDQNLISSYNISPESNIKVMRIKDMINN